MIVHWYLAYALSYRDIMLEHGMSMDNSTIGRWIIHYASLKEI